MSTLNKQVCRTIHLGKQCYPAEKYADALEMLVARGYVRLVCQESDVARYEVTAEGRPLLGDLVD